MFEAQNIESAVEAVLFVSSDAITAKKLAEIMDIDKDKIDAALEGLQKRYEADEAGIQLKQIAGGWRLFSHPDYHDLIEKYIISQDTRKLTGAALETLAIIAYSQPVTRAGVASARGVNSDSSINSLLEKGLLKEAGTADAPGNPVLYATTSKFLEHFGLNSLKDLPNIEDFAPDEKTKALIMERLSTTKVESDQMDLFDDEEFEEITSGSAQECEKSKLGADEDSAADKGLGVVVDSYAAKDSDSGLGSGLDAGSDLGSDVTANKNPAGADQGIETPEDNIDAQSLFATALSSALGTTEKVDVDNLVFDADDE